VASGNYSRSHKDYSSCQYPLSLAGCATKLEFIVAYVSARFGIPCAY
jgi:hypothetical protein